MFTVNEIPYLILSFRSKTKIFDCCLDISFLKPIELNTRLIECN